MGRLANSIALAKASWEVLKADKELMLLPVISMVSTVIAVVVFFVPLLATDAGGASLLVLVALYFVLAYITIFFNAALISAAHERLEGGDPTVGSALRGAASRAGRIVPWALISAVVSVILKALEERAGFLGSIVISLVGMAWNVVTFLVLPIIVIEGMGATGSIKRSVNLFRQTWGENLGAQVGLGLVGFLAALPGIALILAGLGVGGAGFLPLLAVGVIWMVLVAVVMAALSGIFQTALYHFAVGGSAQSGYFDSQILNDAFRTRRRRFGR
ncbi:MAG: DUF6159 family protein [bacterium]|nr:DUF6159 family protein [bacterium]MDE0601817.1 DUF6159 family protein [bacterium]